MQQLVGRHAKFYDDWLAHPDYDDYWKPLNVEEVFHKICDPGAHLRRLVRHLQPGDAARLRGDEPEGGDREGAAHEPHRDRAVGTRPVAEVRRARFRPDRQRRRAITLQLRWYDYWLKGIDNGLASEPPVKLFVMGRNEWVYEREYPLARTDYRPFYFTSGGSANTSRGDGRLTWTKPAGAASTPDRFRYDPGRSGTVARRQQLLRHADGRGPAGSASRRGPPRRPRLHLGRAAGGDRSHRSGQGRALRVVRCRRHRLRRQARGRFPDGSSYNMAEGIVRAPLSREPQQAQPPEAGAGCTGSRSIWWERRSRSGRGTASAST